MKNFQTDAFLKGVIITLIFSWIGFLLFHFNLVSYGYTLFCIMPVIIGYVIGQYPRFSMTFLLSGVVGLVMFLYLLMFEGLEGLGCIVLLFPLILVLFFLGMSIGYLIRQQVDKNKKKNSNGSQLKIYLYPLVLLFLSGFIEKFFTEKYTDVSVETKMILPYPKDVVFNYVKSFDRLDDKTPLMVSLGLIPQPLKCVLEKDSVGAKRTCYFKEGTIEETVTDFKPGEILKMKITNFNLPGRKWLHFEDAVYLLKEINGSTEITRITTYKTELKPRFYWDFCERKAIVAEHDYVLGNLARRLKHK